MILTDRAFVLHTRPYRETSQLVRFFTLEHGLVSAVARGARGGHRQRLSLQPFSLLQIDLRGKSDLKTATAAEALESRFLRGDHLYIGLYLNELLIRLMHESEPHQEIFECYHYLVSALSAAEEPETLLRIFEFNLLNDLGYGFSLYSDGETGEPVDANCRYVFEAGQGIIAVGQSSQGKAFPGSHLLAMAAGDFSDAEVRLSAKHLARQALAPHLGAKPLMSRELFRGAIAERIGGQRQ